MKKISDCVVQRGRDWIKPIGDEDADLHMLETDDAAREMASSAMAEANQIENRNKALCFVRCNSLMLLQVWLCPLEPFFVCLLLLLFYLFEQVGTTYSLHIAGLVWLVFTFSLFFCPQSITRATPKLLQAHWSILLPTSPPTTARMLPRANAPASVGLNVADVSRRAQQHTIVTCLIEDPYPRVSPHTTHHTAGLHFIVLMCHWLCD
jgi:hypothetical protein